MDDSKVVVLIAYIAFGLGFMMVGRWLGRRHFETILTNPCALFCYFYAMTWFIVPVISEATGGHFWQAEYQSQTLWLSLLGFVLFGASCVGTFVIFGGQRANIIGDRIFRDRNKWELEDPITISVIVVVLMIATSVAEVVLLRDVMATGLTKYLATRTTKGSGNGLLLMPLQWSAVLPLIVASQSWMARRVSQKRHWTRFLLGPLLLAATFVGATQASRTRILLPAALLGFTGLVIFGANGLSRRIRVFALGSVALLVFVVFVLGVVRQIATAGSAGGLDKISAVTEAFREYEHTWWLVEHRPAWTPVNGQTIGAGFAVFIPRALWEDKPTGGGPYMVNLVRPRSFVEGRSYNRSSITNGLPSEGYLNFDFPGFALMGSFYGFVFVALSHLLKKCKRPFMVIAWCVLTLRCLEALNMEFLGAVTNVALVGAALVLLFGLDWLIKQMRVRGVFGQEALRPAESS